MVEAVQPRRSVLARPDPFYTHLRQVIVANVDQVLIVAAWREPAFWPELVDRYLIAAARNGLAPIICVNKVDLAEDPVEPQTVLRAYLEAGYTVLLTSAESRLGVDGLRRLLQGRTTALAGLSGVGKSSLLSAVEPGLHLRVGEVSDRRHEGRHTTTQSSLHRLAEGGFVVDTPGIREFGLSGLRRRDLADCYPEIAGLRSDCQFEDCTHRGAPGAPSGLPSARDASRRCAMTAIARSSPRCRHRSRTVSCAPRGAQLTVYIAHSTESTRSASVVRIDRAAQIVLHSILC